MRYLQLSYLGTMRRMEPHRIPRQLLTSWLPIARPRGRRSVSYTDTITKALKFVGTTVQEWKFLASDEYWWSNFISVSAVERAAALAEWANAAPTVANVAQRMIRSQQAVVFGARTTPLSNRRREHLLTGGLLREVKVNRFLNPSTVVDLRAVDSRNCRDPVVEVQRRECASPESVNAQMIEDVGWDDREESTTGVRLSQSGIFYWRGEEEKRSPAIWRSWMKETDKRIHDPLIYTSRTHGPSEPAPYNPICPITVVRYNPVDDRSGAPNRQLFRHASSSVPPPTLLLSPRPDQPPRTPSPTLDPTTMISRYVND